MAVSPHYGVRGGQVKEMVAEYGRRRTYMLKRLKEIGFGIRSEPAGAYYILANAKRFGTDSLELSRNTLEKAGVACTPDIGFGSGEEGFLRFSYSNSLENIAEGMHRLKNYLSKM
jgi:(5-formylfuran-3-yl)methyl phosphate transaminase